MKILVGQLCGVRFFHCDFDHPTQFQSTVDSIASLDLERWTNNPLIVDCFSAENVIVVGTDNKRKALSQHPEYEKWKREMSSGEFWSLVGEEWEPVGESNER